MDDRGTGRRWGRWKGEVDSVRGGPQFGNPWQRREKVDTSRTEPNRTEPSDIDMERLTCSSTFIAAGV